MKKLGTIFLITIFGCLSGCRDIYVNPAGYDENLADFEATWNRINDVYPFLKFKNIDWDALYLVYQKRTQEAQGDEFIQVLNDILAELRDGHIYFEMKGGAQIYPWYPARYFKDKHTYDPFVVRKYFDRELTVTESGSAEYGILPQNIGYIFLSDFHDDYLVHEFPTIVNSLINTGGIIIDIRQRRGGTSQNVEAVVSHFIQEPLAWPKFFLLDQSIVIDPIQPKEPFYSNPVIVLVNGSTFSAGEICTEVLKQLPAVTAVGDTTGGGGVASSGNPPEARGEYILPSGKLIYIGTGYFEKYDGQPFEWVGILPDIRIVNTSEEIENGIDKQLEYAIQFITLENCNR
ncbi:MAG: hypothetical protein JW731_01575 [Bacteroidales bacterium]|nr:hypothetical protein [Bacteroidales bacterium]